jgi:hypothetical protein
MLDLGMVVDFNDNFWYRLIDDNLCFTGKQATLPDSNTSWFETDMTVNEFIKKSSTLTQNQLTRLICNIALQVTK